MLRLRTELYSVATRVGLAFYLIGVALSAALRFYAVPLTRWAERHQFVPSEVFWLARLAPIAVSATGLGMMAMGLWQRIEARQEFGVLSAASARIRAYACAPLFFALLALPLYLLGI